jgi:transcriptional regulator with PAS, ATPase and Fis domain
LDILLGTWKVEGKNVYEVWERNEDNDLVGYSFIMQDKQRKITETLSIKKIGDQIVYEATVPDQNEGKSIQFILNTKIDSLLSFENEMHDFPKKIQYKRIKKNILEVSVLGESGTGFSFFQHRQ